MMLQQQTHGYLAVVHDATAPESPIWDCGRAALVAIPRSLVLVSQDDREPGLFWACSLITRVVIDRPALLGEWTGLELGDQFYANGQDHNGLPETKLAGRRVLLPSNHFCWGVCFTMDPTIRSPHLIPTALRVTGMSPKHHTAVHTAASGLMAWLRERWKSIQHPNPTEQEVARRQARHQDADLIRALRISLDRQAPTRQQLEARQARQERIGSQEVETWSPSAPQNVFA